MKPEYVLLNDTLVSLSNIVSMRGTRTDEEGDYVVSLSGTRQIFVDKAQGEPLWQWLMARAVPPSHLAEL